MIASWMLYALAISILLTVAGVGAERALSARRRPTRFVWVAVIALSIGWPLGPSIARLFPAPSRPVSVLPFTIVVPAPIVSSADEEALARRAALVDRGLLTAWVAFSGLLLMRLAFGAARLTRSRAGWKRGRVNGMRVQLSDNIGPAVVGLRSMDVVLPEWILALDEPLRAIVLCHEEEHRTARDPYLLFGAALAVALMPWNIFLWIQARRLRLAIEMDCDARVLRAHPSPERYGMLILTIAQRRSTAPALFAPMLTEPMTNLERRILAMRTTTKKAARTTVFGGGLVAVAMLAFASSLQSAGTSFPKARVPSVVALAANLVIPAASPETIPVKNPVVITARTPEANPAPPYPAALRAAGVEGAVIVKFTTDGDGHPEPASMLVTLSTNEAFAQSVRATLPTWRFAPHSTGEQPFVFVMADKTGKDLPAVQNGFPRGALVINGAPVAGVVEVSANPTSPAPANDNQTYFEFQVEQQVTPMPGNATPRYPDMLRAANVEGEVLAQFVVDTEGNLDTTTVKLLKSTHELFSNAVRGALPQMRFHPAEVGGKPVRQLVQTPFQFSLTKEP